MIVIILVVLLATTLLELIDITSCLILFFSKDTKKFAYALLMFDCNGLIWDFACGSGYYSCSDEAESRVCREAAGWVKKYRLADIIFFNETNESRVSHITEEMSDRCSILRI